jgi:outer membrane protein assembly factor BamB
MGAFDAASGAATSSLQLRGQYAFSSPPTASGGRRAASGGRVYTGGAGWGGTVCAVDASTAAVEGTASVANGDNSSPAVSSSGVHVSYACGQAYGFRPRSGALLWHRATGCSGGGGTTPVLTGGRLYVRDFSFPAVRDAATVRGPLPARDAASGSEL